MLISCLIRSDNFYIYSNRLSSNIKVALNRLFLFNNSIIKLPAVLEPEPAVSTVIALILSEQKRGDRDRFFFWKTKVASALPLTSTEAEM